MSSRTTTDTKRFLKKVLFGETLIQCFGHSRHPSRKRHTLSRDAWFPGRRCETESTYGVPRADIPPTMSASQGLERRPSLYGVLFNDRVRAPDSRKYYTMCVHADTLCSLSASFAAALRLYIVYPSKRDSTCFMRFFYIYWRHGTWIVHIVTAVIVITYALKHE